MAKSKRCSLSAVKSRAICFSETFGHYETKFGVKPIMSLQEGVCYIVQKLDVIHQNCGRTDKSRQTGGLWFAGRFFTKNKP